MAAVFWISVAGVAYPYFGFPLLLWCLGKIIKRPALTSDPGFAPSISLIIPVHNEDSRISRKLVNTRALDYPPERIQVLFVSDGSTDRTVEIIRANADAAFTLVELPRRGGKAAALNAGLERATNDILVFSDASIELEPESLRRLVAQFRDPKIGCVSGEDRISESGGEGTYGRYEVFLRRLESHVHSIVGASGSFYAQRRALCTPFTEGMAPDFLSVIRTVEQGYRAVTEPLAVGLMTSVTDTKHEFDRKVRTFIRGMTTLFAHPGVLNPLRSAVFAFTMWSHKVLRWTVPFFLVSSFISAIALFDRPFYLAVLVAQVVFYLAALAAWAGWGGIHRSFPGKVSLYFSIVNAAILSAWFHYSSGVRQEIWTPSRR